MNRLQLVQRTIYESGVSALALGSTLNQRGEALNFVNWVDDAYLEIQGQQNWPSMWERADVDVAAGSSIAAGSLAHKRYVKDSAYIGTAPQEYIPWDTFRLLFPVVSAGNPSAWTVRPDRSIQLNAIVEADTQLSVERYRMPGRFTADADVPLLFDEHHMMIVWRALMAYGGFDEAGSVYRRGLSEYGLMKKLASRDLPDLQPGEPLL